MAKKHLTKEELILKEKLKAHIKKIKQAEVKIDGYIGKKVRIKHEDYEMRIKNHELSQKFIDWFEANKNNEFIVESKYNSYTVQLTGVENWIFTLYDLEPVEE